MDFKPNKFKKGDLVVYKGDPSSTLGVVREQSGVYVKILWINWPGPQASLPPARGVMMHKLLRVASCDNAV